MVGHKVKVQSQQTPFLSGASSWEYDFFCVIKSEEGSVKQIIFTITSGQDSPP